MLENLTVTVHKAAKEFGISHTAVLALLKRHDAVPTCPVCTQITPVGNMNKGALCKLGLTREHYIGKMKHLAMPHVAGRKKQVT